MAKNRDRHPLRLKGYDYTQPGGYFVTICTFQNQNTFGEIVDGHMILNDFGRLVEDEWKRTEIIRKEITLDDFVIMPDHLHGIIIIDYVADLVGAHGVSSFENDNPLVGAHGRAPLLRITGSLGSIIAGFKSSATKRINLIRGTPGTSVWQRGYFDRIIRNNKELDRVREYIRTNPVNFGDDKPLF